MDCERVKEMSNVSHSWQNTLLAGNEPVFIDFVWFTTNRKKIFQLKYFFSVVERIFNFDFIKSALIVHFVKLHTYLLMKFENDHKTFKQWKRHIEIEIEIGI